MINILDYCTADNASVGVNQAIKDAKSGDTVSFAKGEYHFYKDFCPHKVYHMTNTDSFVNPDKHFGILMEDKENITIDGNGSVFVMHGDICALAAVRCSGITLKNFTIRYFAPTNIEMTVKEKKGNKIVYTLPKGTVFSVDGRNVTFAEISPFTKKPYYEMVNNRMTWCNDVHRGGGEEVFRTRLSPFLGRTSVKRLSECDLQFGYIIPPKFKVGDVVAISHNKCRDNSGLFFWECKDMVSENLTINYMHGFGWLAQMCENLTYNNITFKAAPGRVVSSFADLIHICGCKGYAKIDNCFFTQPHDDGINIHGAFLRTKKIIDDKTVEFEFVHKQQGGYSAFYKGDKVKFYDRRNLQELGKICTVASAKDDINNKTVVVKFEEKIPQIKKKMSVCENITYNPEVTVTNCTFKAIPTRGILCTTDKKSEICNNKFISLKMPDIYISCDCRDWYESGPCKNMKIHDNVFSQKNPVVFNPLCLGKPVENVHENVEIYDNKIGE